MFNMVWVLAKGQRLRQGRGRARFRDCVQSSPQGPDGYPLAEVYLPLHRNPRGYLSLNLTLTSDPPPCAIHAPAR